MDRKSFDVAVFVAFTFLVLNRVLDLAIELLINSYSNIKLYIVSSIILLYIIYVVTLWKSLQK